LGNICIDFGVVTEQKDKQTLGDNAKGKRDEAVKRQRRRNPSWNKVLWKKLI